MARGWYLVAFGLIGTALAIAITGFMQKGTAINGLQRVVIPGRAQLTLASGRSTIYVETRSIAGGHVFPDAPEVPFQCSLSDINDAPVKLDPPHGSTSYDYGDYAGRAAFDIEVPNPGYYTLGCTADRQLVIAVGGGLTASVLVAIIGGAIPGLTGVVLFLVVFVKRRRMA
jgi:hypothetical protein